MYKEEKIYNRIKKKIENNIDTVYNNEIIINELNSLYSRYQGIKHIILTADKSGVFHKSAIVFNEDKFTNDYLDNLKSLIIQAISCLVELIEKHGKEKYDKELKLLNDLLNDNNKIFDDICKKANKNPFLWRDVVIAKFLGISQDKLMKFIDSIMFHNYLPRAYQTKGNKIIIEINEITTPDEVDYLWQYEVKPIQEEFIKNNKYVNQRKEYINKDRDKRVDQLEKQGKSNAEIEKILEKEGYKTYHFPSIGKLKKAFKDKYQK